MTAPHDERARATAASDLPEAASPGGGVGARRRPTEADPDIEPERTLPLESPPDLAATPAAELRRRAIEAALFGDDAPPLMAGPFRLLEALGSGGMGTVFAAVDGASGEDVAVKVMSTADADARRFDREVAVLAGLRHPRIVRYVAHGRTAEGRPYLAMERLRGEDLEAALARRRPTIRECIDLALDVAEGLRAAHTQGVIHRDIKPSNLFLVDGAMGGAKILDFGIARARGALPSVTNPGAILGTVGYMAPEQARGEARIDARADLFSLACVLYEALTGEPPFPGDHAVAILAKILLDEPRPLRELRPEVPTRLAALVEAALAKRPEARPTSTEAMIAELRACVDEAPIEVASAVAAISYRERRALCLLLVASPRALELPYAATVERTIDESTARAAEAFGATVTPLLDGTEILAFECEGPIGDVVAEAARCALAIRASRPGVRQALAVGRVERRGDSVLGRVIDHVSALVADARADVILLDDAAAPALERAFAIEADEGRARLVAERDAPALDLLLGRRAPFVGRARELGWLGGRFEHCVEEARSVAVILRAPPGVGKSRLWREFARGLAASGHDPRVLVLRCAATLQSSPFGALTAALRHEAGITRGLGPDEARERVRVRFGGDGGAGRLPFLAELCGVDLGGSDGETQALARGNPTAMADAQRLAWLDWLRAEVERRPLLVVVDDLHWCDAATADLVRAALSDLGERSLMVLATTRVEGEERFPGWPSADAESLELGPITARASEMLIRQVLGAIPASLVESLVARADGNPFFLEELMRTLGGGKVSTLPESVLSVIESRLRRQSDEARRLLRAASVFDSAFDPAAIAALLGRPVDEIQRRLDGLVAAEHLVVDEVRGRALYRFHHALVRDTAYAMLAEADRPAAHRAAAEWLAVVDEHEPAVIAEHYARSGASAEASAWFARAARRAMGSGDVVAAASLADRALEFGVDGRSLAEVLIVQADVALWRGDLRALERHTHQALGLVPAGSTTWFSTIRRLIGAADTSSRISRGRELTGLLLAHRDPSSSEFAICLADAIYTLLVAGAYDEARALIAELDVLAEVHASIPLVTASIYRTRSALAGLDHDLGRSLELAQRAIDPFEEAGELQVALRLRAVSAYLHLCFGATERAHELCEGALGRALRLGAELPALYCQIVRSRILALDGRADEARALLQEVRGRAGARGLARVRLYALIFEVQSFGAEDGGSLAAIRDELHRLDVNDSLRLLGSAVLARALDERGDLAAALELVERDLPRLRGRASTLDDVFYVWSTFVSILDHAGADDEADRTAAEALERVAAAWRSLVDPAVREALLAHRPVVYLRRRAEDRGLVIDLG
ncbi:MAG: protein kinase [Nannocystaceae bacterium]